MAKIKQLTPEQEAKIPEFIAKWVNMASKPTDRNKATKAVKDMYRSIDEKEPIVIFGPSPFSTAIMAAMFFGGEGGKHVKLDAQLIKQLDNRLRDRLDTKLFAHLRAQLYARLRDRLDDQLLDRLDDQLLDQLGNQLRDQLYDQLDDQLLDQLYAQLRDHLSDQLYNQLYNQLRDQMYAHLRTQLEYQLYAHLRTQLLDQLKEVNKHWYMPIWWLPWCGWYDYGQYIGVEFDKEQYDLFISFVSNVGFIIPYRGIAFVSEAPTRIVWNAGRLHYDHGKAVEYKDGWGLYMLRGVRFSEEQYNAIVNEELTLEDLAQDKYKLGDDQRVVAIQMLRPDRLLEQVGAKLIDTSPFTGTRLYRVDDFMGTGETEYCIRMEHPSIEGREYIEWVDPEVGKVGRADYAQAVAFGVPEEDLYVVSVKA